VLNKRPLIADNAGTMTMLSDCPAPAKAAPSLTDEVVFDYWQNKAAESGDRPDVTIRDTHYLDLEIGKICTHLTPSDRVLDVGCGTGITTGRFARHCAEVVGVDFSPNMIAIARDRLATEPPDVRGKVRFECGDARRLDFPDRTFSRVISQRCLINIPDRWEQAQAVHEYARVLAPGGLLLLSEVTLQGHERVNHFRRQFGLSRLKVHWHNTYLDEPAFLADIAPVFKPVDTIRFGTYGFISKVILPLLCAPDEPSFDHPLNAVARQIAEKMPDIEGCIHHALFVLRRR